MRKVLGVAVAVVMFLAVACRQEQYMPPGEVKLRFSVDTLYFDTVFTTVGSATRLFRVYNPHDRTVRIDEVRLGKVGGPFRINVDGESGPAVKDVEILPHDSLYLFVEVTIDPLGANMPLMVHDSILFITGDRVEDVDLVAWGQDVHLYDGRIIGTETWQADKPYLIVHSMMVDTGAVLTIRPGVKVYSHFGSTIYVAGTLIVEGTRDEPVLFSGDRLEPMYFDIPGQWSGIYILNGSQGNRIDHAEIRNGTYGVHLGNFYAEDPPPDLRITNTVIEHMNWAGISSVGASVMAANCVVADCGYYALTLTTGGDYRFVHCTVANFWRWSNRRTPSVVVSDHYILNDSVLFTGELVRAEFLNSILWGDLEDEFAAAPLEEGDTLAFLFDHVLLRATNTGDTARFHNVWNVGPPGFADVWNYDYRLDSSSVARDRGAAVYAQEVPEDLAGYDRMADGRPDLGAYEYQPADTAGR